MFWGYWDHADNPRRNAILRAIKAQEELLNALHDVEQYEKDAENANSVINDDLAKRKSWWFSPGNVSDTFESKEPKKKQLELPDKSKEFKAMLKKWGLEEWTKSGTGSRARNRGKTSGIYPKGSRPPDLDFKGNGVDEVYEWDTNRKPNQNQNQQKPKGNQNQNQNRNQPEYY